MMTPKHNRQSAPFTPRRVWYGCVAIALLWLGLVSGACQCIVVLPPAGGWRGERFSDGQLRRELIAQDESLLDTADAQDAVDVKDSPCIGGRPPTSEVCDGIDNDCDGDIDEDGVCGVCTPGRQRNCGTGVGSCEEGVQTCTNQRKWGLCLASVQPTPEVCDGVDNDCDGKTDNDIQTRPCTINRPGPCSKGKTECRAGKLTCIPTTQPTTETCDGIDNDCNGRIDDGITCQSNGCADGTREGFVDINKYKDIAGCSGGWSVPGIHTSATKDSKHCPQGPENRSLQPACQRKSGNSTSNPNGKGCTVEDLCAAGWHVCRNAGEVAKRSPDGCKGAAPSPTPPLFFATRQTGTGCGSCATGTSTDPQQCNSSSCKGGCAQTSQTSNDIFGCGNYGGRPRISTCRPLDRFSSNICGTLQSPWRCNDNGGGLCEAFYVTKSGPTFGGVLCCRD